MSAGAISPTESKKLALGQSGKWLLEDASGGCLLIAMSMLAIHAASLRHPPQRCGVAN